MPGAEQLTDIRKRRVKSTERSRRISNELDLVLRQVVVALLKNPVGRRLTAFGPIGVPDQSSVCDGGRCADSPLSIFAVREFQQFDNSLSPSRCG